MELLISGSKLFYSKLHNFMYLEMVHILHVYVPMLYIPMAVIYVFIEA